MPKSFRNPSITGNNAVTSAVLRGVAGTHLHGCARAIDDETQDHLLGIRLIVLGIAGLARVSPRCRKTTGS
jgi:hypothetical protein